MAPQSIPLQWKGLQPPAPQRHTEASALPLGPLVLGSGSTGACPGRYKGWGKQGGAHGNATLAAELIPQTELECPGEEKPPELSPVWKICRRDVSCAEVPSQQRTHFVCTVEKLVREHLLWCPLHDIAMIQK